MNIWKYLDISTAHLSKRDHQLLEGYVAGAAGAKLHLVTYDNPYGYFVSTSGLQPGTASAEEIAERFRLLEAAGHSEALIAIVKRAVAEACTLIRFDRDAAPGDFPVYDD